MKIVILSKNKLIRDALLSSLDTSDIKTIKTFDNSKNAIEYLKVYPIDFVLIDFGLDFNKYLSFIERLNRFEIRTKPLIISFSKDYILPSFLIQKGAIDVISYNTSTKEIKAILKRYKEGKVCKEINNKIYLSNREFEVYRHLYFGKRNKEIAKELDITSNSVHTYKKRILKKFEVDNLLDIIFKDKIKAV